MGQARAFVCVRGGGVGVCDCQLWERDPPPPGGAKVREKRKKEQEIEKREQVCGEMGGKRRRNEGECCFDVKGDGRVVVGRARGRKRKVKERGLNGSAGGEDEGKTRGRGDPRQ